MLLDALTLTACGTNPVTAKTELHFVSTTSKILMGEQAYFPTRNQIGNDLPQKPRLRIQSSRDNFTARRYSIAYKELIYTVIIRAKDLVAIVASEEILVTGIKAEVVRRLGLSL